MYIVDMTIELSKFVTFNFCFTSTCVYTKIISNTETMIVNTCIHNLKRENS